MSGWFLGFVPAFFGGLFLLYRREARRHKAALARWRPGGT